MRPAATGIKFFPAAGTHVVFFILNAPAAIRMPAVCNW